MAKSRKTSTDRGKKEPLDSPESDMHSSSRMDNDAASASDSSPTSDTDVDRDEEDITLSRPKGMDS